LPADRCRQTAKAGLGTLPVMVPLTRADARFCQRLQRGGYRTGAGLLVIASGVADHRSGKADAVACPSRIEARGCRSLPA